MGWPRRRYHRAYLFCVRDIERNLFRLSPLACRLAVQTGNKDSMSISKQCRHQMAPDKTVSTGDENARRRDGAHGAVLAHAVADPLKIRLDHFVDQILE
jgi:hypothetical protein